MASKEVITSRIRANRLGYNCFLVDTRKVEGFYETMVFPVKFGRTDYGEDLDCRRYDNFEDARQGHEEIVKKWSE